MTNPLVTVNLGSNRPGGIDIVLAGLSRQTFQDFEVIFVDGRYHQRHQRVLEAVKASGLRQPFYHVPNHRFKDDIWGSTCAGYNTGFALSAGEIVVMLLDYGYCPPTWLEEHVKHQKEPKVVMAPHEYRSPRRLAQVTETPGPFLDFMIARDDQPADMHGGHERYNVDLHDPLVSIETILQQRRRFDEISVFDKPFTPEMLEDFPIEASEIKCMMGTGPSNYRYFNTKNESFPTDAVLSINGMDENYDRGRGPGDPDIGFRLERYGLPQWVVHEALVHCINPRRILPNLNLVAPEAGHLPPPHDQRWSYLDGCAYFDRVVAEGTLVARNPFDIREMRKHLWHWRELSQEPETAIDRHVVSDAEYFK